MEQQFPCLRVMAEYGSSGIWVVKPFGPFRHGMIGHKKLALPDDLARRFREWIDLYWKILDSLANFDSASFNQEGRRLAHALKQHMGFETEVLSAPIGPDNRLGADEHVD